MTGEGREPPSGEATDATRDDAPELGDEPYTEIPTPAERLRQARRDLRDRKMLMTPGERGAHGCLTASLRMGAVGAALVVIVAPCTAGIPLGLFGAIAGMVTGTLVGIPLVIAGSRALETAMLEKRIRGLERPKLPEGGSAPAGAPVAVGSAVDDTTGG